MTGTNLPMQSARVMPPTSAYARIERRRWPAASGCILPHAHRLKRPKPAMQDAPTATFKHQFPKKTVLVQPRPNALCRTPRPL